MNLVHFAEGTDELGSETATVTVTDGDLYATHTSFRRGGCLYAGTVVVRNLGPYAPAASHEIDVTSRASDHESHLRYLIGLAEKHVGASS